MPFDKMDFDVDAFGKNYLPRNMNATPNFYLKRQEAKERKRF
jgi:hypothetical protein